MLYKAVTCVLRIICCFVLMSCAQRVQIYPTGDSPNSFRDLYILDNEISNIKPPVIFSRGTSTDSREYVGAPKKGPVVVTVLEDKELGDTFYDGLRLLLVDSNQVWVESETSGIRVDVELLTKDLVIDAEFSEDNILIIEEGSPPQMMSSVSVNVVFADSETEKKIYQQTYEGLFELQRQASGAAAIKHAENGAIVDCLNKMGMDKDLAKALMEMRSGMASEPKSGEDGL